MTLRGLGNQNAVQGESTWQTLYRAVLALLLLPFLLAWMVVGRLLGGRDDSTEY